MVESVLYVGYWIVDLVDGNYYLGIDKMVEVIIVVIVNDFVILSIMIVYS